MKAALIVLFLLTSCTATEVGNALIPDELTLGRGKGTSELDGKLDTHWSHDSWPSTYEGDHESTYAALTWHLPSIADDYSRKEREDLRKDSLIIDAIVNEELSESTTMASGGAYKADWRHAAGFGGVLLVLLVILLVKLQRSNGWH